MAISNLIPFRKGRKEAMVRAADMHPWAALQRRMNRLFDDFFADFGLAPFEGWDTLSERFIPSIDLAETDTDITVTAELPGMDEKDIQVQLEGDTLTIRGEKKSETEHKDAHRHLVERSYGQFARAVVLPAEVDDSKAQASYKNGVLTIKLPKTAAEIKKTKRIDIKKE